MTRAICFLAAFWLLAAGQSWATETRETYESPQPSWRLVKADCGVRLLSQQRILTDAHGGQGCEHLRILAGKGSYVYASQQIPAAQIIPELLPSLWVKSDRPGIQLMARVVFPRSEEPQGGKPLTALLRGQMYQNVDSWQRLEIPNIDRLLSRQVRVLRTQFGPQVDPRGAYLDLLVLNLYGGAGDTNIWIDDLELAGRVAAPAAQPGHNNYAQRASFNAPHADSTSTMQRGESPRLRGSVLHADGRPLMLRAIEYRGESLQWLQSLGFNAVELDRPATPEQLQEARRLKMWLFAPPPQVDNGQAITAAHNRVLAWKLGDRLTAHQQQDAKELADKVRRADPIAGRPLVCGVKSQHWFYSRQADILLIERNPLGSGLELALYGRWVGEQIRFARQGTPVWARIQTEAADSLMAQASTFSRRQESLPLDPRQIRLLTMHAVSAGARGVCFQSSTRLDARDEATQLRRLTLQSLNRELALLEPWIAAGAVLGKADTGTTEASVSLIKTDRSRLAIALRTSAGQQYVLGAAEGKAVSFVFPGAPISAQAYRISATGLHSLRKRNRDAGGVRITLNDDSLVSLVVLTEDPLVVNYLNRNLAAGRLEAAQRRLEIVSRWQRLVEEVDRRLTQQGRPLASAADWLGRARASYQQAQRMLAARDSSSALQALDRVETLLAKVGRGHWEQAVRNLPSPASSPFCATITSLPHQLAWEALLRGARFGGNRLPGGQMEDLRRLQQSGWRHHRFVETPLSSTVEISRQVTHSGQASLRLAAWMPAGKESPDVVDTPPVWITSPPVAVRRGEQVRIDGWVKIHGDIAGSADGLLVFDSLGGASMGERIRGGGSWRPFTLYRVAPRDARMTVTFVLTGMGEAFIDDVSVRAVESLTVPKTTARSGPMGRR